jgi:hypothetical protein
VTCSICLLLLLLYANRRDEVSLVWQGKIYDFQHKNRVQHENDITDTIKEGQELPKLPYDIFSIPNCSSSASRQSA